MSLFLNVLVLIVMCVVINYFADVLGDNLEKVALKLNISPGIRGAIFDGVSSSVPELLTASVAAIAVLGIFGDPDPTAFSDVGVGTIGGSAIFNILIIPFLSILFTPKESIDEIEIDKKSMLRDIVVYVMSIGLLFYGSYTGLLGTKIGLMMTVLYIIYVYILLKSNKGNEESEFTEKPEGPTWKYLTICLCSLVPIGFAVHYCVISASNIGIAMNIPRIIMSLVVLAATTSIPDTLLSIRSAKNGELDASISNAVGSNSFDICIALGAVLLISRINVNVNFSEVAYIFVFLIIASLCYTTAFLFKTNKGTKLALLGIPYVAFIGYLFKITN